MLHPNITGIVPSSVPRQQPEDAWLTPGRFAALLALLTFASFPSVLLGGGTFVFRDYSMFSYPVAYFHRESFWHGELPLWNPLNQCGVPFLAQWNTLTLYPLSLLYLLLPLTWSLPFFSLAHLFWGGLGMYCLAHRWTRHRLAAALAGIVFAFNGLTLNFLMWPSHVATFSWLPWVLWLAPQAWRFGGRLMLWAILAAAMQMLAGGPETIVFTWLILFLFAVGDWLSHRELRLLIFQRFLLLGTLVLLICAAQLLPFLELLLHSQRDSSYGSASHDWSMPFWGWANFLVPLFRASPYAYGVCYQNGQYWTSSYYAGIGTVLLGFVAMRRVSEWRVRLLALLVFLGLVLAWGDASLVFSTLHKCFPAIGFVRYPVKFLILVLALAPLMAASGASALASQTQKPGRFELGCAFILLLLVGSIVAVDWTASIPDDVRHATLRNGLERAAFLVSILGLSVLFLRSHQHKRIIYGSLLLTAFWLDLVTHVPNQNPTVPPSVYAPGYADARLNWNPTPKLGQSRVLVSPVARDYLSQVLLPNPAQNYLRNRLAARADCNLLDAIPQVDGFFSLTPREIFKLTTFPYLHRDHAVPALLDFMAVSQTTAPGTLTGWSARPTALPVVTAGQQPVFANDPDSFNALLQTNADLRQTVFLPLDARGAVSATRQHAAHVRPTQFTFQKVTIQTDAPGPTMVVIAQTWYPAWKACVDGQPVRIWRANYAFQALQVPAGRHEVQLRYQDRTLVIGAVLSGVGLLATATLWLLRRRQFKPGSLPCSADP